MRKHVKIVSTSTPKYLDEKLTETLSQIQDEGMVVEKVKVSFKLGSRNYQSDSYIAVIKYTEG